jgi:hypothetical protein
MSDVQTTDAPPGDADGQDDTLTPPPLPNLSVTMTTQKINGRDKKVWVVSYGTYPIRVIEVAPPDLGDQFDLAEMAGDNMSQLWLGMAMSALAVRSVDNVPMFRGQKENLRETLRRLGEDGLRAVNWTLAQSRQESAEPASVAKNSSGIPASAT